MTELTRDEMFARDLEIAKRERAEKEEKKNNQGAFQETKEYEKWGAIPRDKFGLFRLLGKPLNFRKDPTDPKLVTYIKAISDEDRTCYMYIPTRKEDPNHFFYRIWKTVMKYEYVDDVKVYTNQKDHPGLFDRMLKNNNTDPKFSKMEKGMTPQNIIVFNAIDYSNIDWHKNNKHSVLLSKRNKRSKSGNDFMEKGIPEMCYDNILSIVETRGDWSNYQIAMKSLATLPYYVFSPAVKEKEDLARIQPELIPLIEDRVMSDEELSWELYNIDEVFAVSSFTKWKNKLGLLIQQIDKAFGTSFYDEICVGAEKEKELWDKEKSENEVKTESVIPSIQTPENDVNPFDKPVQETPAQSRRAPVVNENSKAFDVNAYKENFQYVTSLTQQERDTIIGVDHSSDNFFVYAGNPELAPCIDCNFNFPVTFATCPNCGKVYTPVPF